MSSVTQAACNCMGKAPNCTCDGKCRCACTCLKDKLDNTFDIMGWMYEADPYEGQAVHKTKKGKGATAQAIARDKLRRLPPNCS